MPASAEWISLKSVPPRAAGAVAPLLEFGISQEVRIRHAQVHRRAASSFAQLRVHPAVRRALARLRRRVSCRCAR